MGSSLGLIEIGEEVLSELIRPGVDEEEREPSEVAEEGVQFEEELRVRDGVAGSWVRSGRVPGLVRPGVGNVCPSDAYDSVKELWVGGGVAISWMRVGCVLSSAWSQAGGDFPSDSDSLAHMAISLSSKMSVLFRGHEVSFGYRPIWE